jgi:hypothetical protein
MFDAADRCLADDLARGREVGGGWPKEPGPGRRCPLDARDTAVATAPAEESHEGSLELLAAWG